MSHLHARLTQVENYAEVLEKRVYRKLCSLDLMLNEYNIQQEEKQILALLWKLDELQTEIDDINANLKAQGLNVVVRYDGNVYKAKPKKMKAPPKPKRQEWSDRKVYPVDSPTPAKLKAKRDAAKAEQRAAVEARKAARAEATRIRQEEQLAAKQAAREAREAARKAKQEALEAEKQAKAAKRAETRQAINEAREAEKLAAQEDRAAARAEAIKLKQTVRNAERKAAAEARAANRAARQEPKPKPQPKTRKPRESYELKLAKKRRDNAIMRLGNLDGQIEQERRVLLKRLEERKERIKLVADWGTDKKGPQARRVARGHLQNVQAQLDGLEQRKQDRFESLTAQLELAEYEITQLQLNENASQVMV